MLTAGVVTDLRGKQGASRRVVVLTQEGFFPSVIHIERGDSIAFRTTRDDFFWPASDLHSSHDLYPEFDPKEPIAKTDSWIFRFNRPGKWRYHDHLAPQFRGEIIVTDPDAAVAARCRNADVTRQECLDERIASVLRAEGLDAAFDLFASLYDTVPVFRGYCHDSGHRLGAAAYRLRAQEKDFRVTPKTAACSFGFYHGFMEMVVSEGGGATEAGNLCAYVNRVIGREAPDATMQCYHGIGHGIVDMQAARLARARQGKEKELRITERGLAFCADAAAGAEERSRCATGVFNGISFLYMEPDSGIRMDPSAPLGLCAEGSAGAYQRECYLSMNSALLWRTEKNMADAAVFISAIPHDAARRDAMINLAAAAQSSSSSLETAVHQCRTIDKRLHIPCVQGYAYGYLERGRPGEEYKEALGVCFAPLLSGEERDACLDYIFSYFNQWYSQEKAQEICKGLDTAYREKCWGKLTVPYWVPFLYNE